MFCFCSSERPSLPQLGGSIPLTFVAGSSFFGSSFFGSSFFSWPTRPPDSTRTAPNRAHRHRRTNMSHLARQPEGTWGETKNALPIWVAGRAIGKRKMRGLSTDRRCPAEQPHHTATDGAVPATGCDKHRFFPSR